MNTQYENCYKAVLDFIVISNELNNTYAQLEKSSGSKDDSYKKVLNLTANRLEKQFFFLKHSLEKITIINTNALDLALELKDLDSEYTKCATNLNYNSTLEIEGQVYLDDKLTELETTILDIKYNLESVEFSCNYSWI